ncbi:MAG: mucoidy inhibitor MuiA family protein [Flavobacteriales bacterium]|nr:mucoidy inhibitor MuiA family protein [Flavobacteriales bacterium]
MKKQFILIAFGLLITSSSFAKTIDSRISSVTVYLNGAQVYRKATTSLKKGTNEIIIDDVSPFLNTKSIQAGTAGSPLILNVKHQIEYNDPVFVSEPLPEKIQSQINILEDSLFFQNLQLQKIRNQIYNLDQEKKIITNNKTIRGEGKSDSLAIFMQAVEFYHQKLNILENELLQLRTTEHGLAKKLNRTEYDLEELRNYSAHKTVQPSVKPQVHQIVLTVHSDYDTEAEFNVSYLVNRAGWIPSYDLRATGASDPVNLTYKASIYQKTGEDWDNVKLTLSTFNQSCSFTVPTLAMWEIQDKAESERKNANRNLLGYAASDTTMMIQQGNFYSNTIIPTSTSTDNLSAVTFNSAFTGTTFNATTSNGFTIGTQQDQFILPKSLAGSMDKTLSNVEFTIKNRYSIKADGKETMMVVNNLDMNSKFNYISVPKLDTDAFLLTNITDWRKHNLLPAKANIYFNNSFVGETDIQPSQMSDTLSLAIGRERGFEITRKKIDDDAKEKVVGSNIKREITIEIAVKNTTGETAQIELKDQIPVSKTDNIKVKEIDLAGARLDENTGILSWKLKLAPNEGKIIKFTYEVVHDKEIEVI